MPPIPASLEGAYLRAENPLVVGADAAKVLDVVADEARTVRLHAHEVSVCLGIEGGEGLGDAVAHGLGLEVEELEGLR